MTLYPNYKSLIRSNLYDQYVLRYIKRSGYTLFPLIFISDQLVSFLAIGSLYLNTKIESWLLREIISWLTLTYFLSRGSWGWISLLLTIRGLRLFCEYGIPYFFQGMSQVRLSEDLETFGRRMYSLLMTREQDLFKVYLQCVGNLLLLREGDSSQQFTPEENELVQKFFREFPEGTFLIDDKQFTVILRSFLLRLDSSSLHLIRSASIRVNESSEFCTICQSTSQQRLELRCHHGFCLECIFKWINNGHSDCPLCRGTIF